MCGRFDGSLEKNVPLQMVYILKETKEILKINWFVLLLLAQSLLE